MLYIVIVLGIVVLCLAYKNWIGRSGEKYLISVIRQQQKDLAAYEAELHERDTQLAHMEQGRDEQEENYEMQFLTFEEHLVAQAREIQELEAYLEKHDRECLPTLKDLRWTALAGSVENA